MLATPVAYICQVQNIHYLVTLTFDLLTIQGPLNKASNWQGRIMNKTYKTVIKRRRCLSSGCVCVCTVTWRCSADPEVSSAAKNFD